MPETTPLHMVWRADRKKGRKRTTVAGYTMVTFSQNTGTRNAGPPCWPVTSDMMTSFTRWTSSVVRRMTRVTHNAKFTGAAKQRPRRNEMTTEVECLVMLPPYVAPEHRALVEQAEQAIADYEKMLISRLRAELEKDCGPSIKPSPVYLRMLEKQFYDDPIRRHLFKNFAEIKSLVEKPRFMLKAT